MPEAVEEIQNFCLESFSNTVLSWIVNDKVHIAIGFAEEHIIEEAVRFGVLGGIFSRLSAPHIDYAGASDQKRTSVDDERFGVVGAHS